MNGEITPLALTALTRRFKEINLPPVFGQMDPDDLHAFFYNGGWLILIRYPDNHYYMSVQKPPFKGINL